MIYRGATISHFWERLTISIVLTFLVIFHESSWFNTVFFPTLNIQLEEVETET